MGVEAQVGAVGETMGSAIPVGITSSDRELPIPRGVNHGGTEGIISPVFGVWDRASYIPQYFDDGVALTCEYLAEGFEFLYSVLNKMLLDSLAFLNICLKSHTIHKGLIFI